LEILLENGSNIEMRDNDGNSTVHWAVLHRRFVWSNDVQLPKTETRLADHEATPLHYDASKPVLEILRLLVDKGAGTMNTPDNQRWFVGKGAQIRDY
jgi:ankyrin repeat protein